jgi:hypothetical protein
MCLNNVPAKAAQSGLLPVLTDAQRMRGANMDTRHGLLISESRKLRSKNTSEARRKILSAASSADIREVNDGNQADY